MAVNDILGKKFGRLTVIKRLDNNYRGDAMWLCKCDCGNLKSICGHSLRKDKTKSCGCITKELSHEKKFVHGMANSRLHCIWSGIKSRCNNPNNEAYHNYGGRGIKVCEEWNDFCVFYSWAMLNGYSDQLTIDRIDVYGNYEPNNCRWSTMKLQSNNKRNNHYIEFKGEKHSISEWSQLTGLNYETIRGRVRRGLSPEQILNKCI